MKVDFTTAMQDFDGNPITESGMVVTMGTVCSFALNNANCEPQESLHRGRLAMRVHNAEEIEISPEEASMIRAALPQKLSPMIVAQAHELLEGK